MNIDSNGLLLENYVALELDNAVNSFSRYLRHIHSLLSPIIDTAHSLQAEWGNINLEKVETSSSGICTPQVCIDASTTIPHTENDCTYTVIIIPKQVNDLGMKVKKHAYFLFLPNETNKLIIPLQQHISFLYTGSRWGAVGGGGGGGGG